MERCRGDVSPMGRAIEVADNKGWQLHASAYGVAMPSGTVEDAVLEIWWEQGRVICGSFLLSMYCGRLNR